MLGRSMGGGVTLNALVAYPGLVEAAVIYASVSSSFPENLVHFTEPNRPEELQQFYARFGTPQDNPRFYRDLSSRTYFDRITEPVLIHHGTADETCPFPWARTTQRLLERAGVDSTLEVYEGEHHAFVPRWQDSIERTVQFLRAALARVIAVTRCYVDETSTRSRHGTQRAAGAQAGGDARLDRRSWSRATRPSDLVRPEILTSWTRSEAAISADVAEAPLADEGETASIWQRLPPPGRRRDGSSPSSVVRPRTATWCWRSPTPRPGSCGRTAAG